MGRLEIRRGDVVVVTLEPSVGKQQRGRRRPCIVVQNDVGNQYAPTTIVVPLTNAAGKKIYPFQASVDKHDGGVDKDRIAKCEQVRVIDRQLITKKLGHLSSDTLGRLDAALRISLAL